MGIIVINGRVGLYTDDTLDKNIDKIRWSWKKRRIDAIVGNGNIFSRLRRIAMLDLPAYKWA